MYFTSLKFLILMWQLGLVDTFTVVDFLYNSVAQYSAIAGAAIADGNRTNFPGVLFEPIAGFKVSYQFVKAAQTAAERRGRVATLAALLSASTATAVGSTPAANVGLGAAIAAQIAHMRDVLKIRGGSILGSEVQNFKIVLDSVPTSILKIHPYRKKFTENSKMIINNLFQEHTARRYLEGSTQKIKTVAPPYLAPMAVPTTPNSLHAITSPILILVDLTLIADLLHKLIITVLLWI